MLFHNNGNPCSVHICFPLFPAFLILSSLYTLRIVVCVCVCVCGVCVYVGDGTFTDVAPDLGMHICGYVYSPTFYLFTRLFCCLLSVLLGGFVCLLFFSSSFIICYAVHF